MAPTDVGGYVHEMFSTKAKRFCPGETFLCWSFWVLLLEKYGERSLRQDAANHTPEVCAPLPR
jgi:hypothetical protein